MKYVFILAAILIMACNRSPENGPYQPGISTSFNRTGNLVGAYLDLRSSLSHSDPKDARAEAGQLAEKATKLESKHSPAIHKTSAAIAGTDDLVKQRELFAELSHHVIELAKTGLPDDRRMYVLHCPMALNNKGADWLSETHDRDVENPYLGSKEPECAEVKEEIQ